MSRTFDFCETMLDWVDGRINQRMIQPLWFGGGIGASGGQGYRPFKGQLVQSAITFDTTEAASPCYPSGTSSLVDNLNRIRNWQKPATWFQVKELASGLIIYIEEGTWWPQQDSFVTWSGGNSPTFTAPSGAYDRIDTLYALPGGALGIEQGTAAASPAIPVPTTSGVLPLWAIRLTPTSTDIKISNACDYVAGDAYVTKDMRPFLNLGGAGGGGGVSYFTLLTDTPGSYTGHGEEYVTVTVGEDALEFTSVSPIDEFTELTDTPSSYTNCANRYVTVTSGAGALEFTWINEVDIIDLDHAATGIRNKLIRNTIPASGQILRYDGVQYWEMVDPVVAFTQLTDTPSSYSGHGEEFVTVTNGEDALEFTTIEEADITNLDHDAQKIKGKVVNASGIGHNKVLAYSSVTDTINYVTQSGGGGNGGGGGTTSFFVPTTNVYTFECGFGLADNAQAETRGCFSVPTNYKSDLKVKVIIRSPYGSGYCYGYNDAQYGQCGESYSLHNVSGSNSAAPIVTMHNNCVYEISLSSATVGDIVNIRFMRRADMAQDTINQDIWVPGWIVTFT